MPDFVKNVTGKLSRTPLRLKIFDHLLTTETTTIEQLMYITGASEDSVRQALKDIYPYIQWKDEKVKRGDKTVKQIRVLTKRLATLPISSLDIDILEKACDGEELTGPEHAQFEAVVRKLRNNAAINPNANTSDENAYTPQPFELESRVHKFTYQVMKNMLAIDKYPVEKLALINGKLSILTDKKNPMIKAVLKGTKDFFPCGECNAYFNGCLIEEIKNAYRDAANGKDVVIPEIPEGMTACQVRFLERFSGEDK